MATRATGASVGAAFNVWSRTLEFKGAHTDGLKLTRADDTWRIDGADASTPIPCGDTRGFLGNSTRAALDALRRSTSQLGMVPAERDVEELSQWLTVFNESEMTGCRDANRQRLRAMAPGQYTAMRVVSIPRDAAFVLFEDERYKLVTGMNYLASVPTSVRMPVTLKHVETGEDVTKMLNRIHRFRVTPDVSTGS